MQNTPKSTEEDENMMKMKEIQGVTFNECLANFDEFRADKNITVVNVESGTKTDASNLCGISSPLACIKVWYTEEEK